MAGLIQYMRQLPQGVVIRMLFHTPLLLPHLLSYQLCSKKELINEDLDNFRQWPDLIDSNCYLGSLMVALVVCKEFRNVFYMRLGTPLSYLPRLCLHPINDVFLGDAKNIAGGFCLDHGFGTVINANCKIGRNCTVLHGVTIGDDWKGGVPMIGNDVFIGCHAILLGDIKIGNNVKIGAGAIVLTDIPDNATAVGEKARIIADRGGLVFTDTL